LGKVDDLAAVGAHSEMGEGVLSLMERQSILYKCVEMVRIGMLAGLE